MYQPYADPFLVFAWLVAIWARRLAGGRSHEPISRMPSIGDAPLGSEPIIGPQLDDNGLGTYSLRFTNRADS